MNRNVKRSGDTVNVGPGLNVAVLVKGFISTGGSERYAVEVTRRLIERGHHIDLYARRADEALSAGLHHRPVPNRMRFSSFLNSLSFARETRRMLSGRNYDVVHSHELGFAQDISTVHTFSYKSGMSKYSPLRRITKVYLSPRSLVYLWLWQKQMGTPWLAAVSDVIKEDIRKFYHREENVSVITPGVDTERFHPAALSDLRKSSREAAGVKDDEMAVLFVGSEFRRKGLDDLIPAIGPGMRLIVAGEGERMEHYQSLAKRHGLAERIRFMGLVEDVRPCFAMADVAVLPSISEAFGMSILEGMACGLPVVARTRAGVSGIIENGKSGYVFDEPSELPRILERLMEPSLRSKLGDEARKAAESHTWNAAADRYERLYYEISEFKKSRDGAAPHSCR